MLNAILVVTLLALAFGLLLGWAAVRLRVQGEPLVEEINKLLPQTQCGQCGFPGCRPYAKAIADSQAEINRCPPGGTVGIQALAQLLNRDVLELDAERGVEKPKAVAWIDESICIGCTKCIQACPVDAIVGATKLMHTVIADHCTGCELCLPPCPVDCILLLPAATGIAAWRPALPMRPAPHSELR